MAVDLSAALTVNERTRPILAGEFAPEGVRLHASGLFPAEIFWRQLKFAEFDLSEMSLASLMIATARGETPWVALPIFTHRQFFHTSILVRRDRGIDVPADLAGKRVGVPEFQQTRSVWQRGVLHDEFGVDEKTIAWVMERSPDRSHGGATGFAPPPGLQLTYADPATDLGALLLAGDIDATLYHYEEKNLVDRGLTSLRGRSEVRTLFADPPAEGRRYFAKTGIFPINHCVVLRKSLAERHPWLPLNIYAAFLAAKNATIERRAASMRPLFDLGLLPESARHAERYDAFPYGVRSSRLVLETIARYLRDSGLTSTTVALEQVFHASTLDV